MEYVIAVAWFIAGLAIGVTGTAAYVIYLGERQIKMRKNRIEEWKKIKKNLDKDFQDEYGI